MRTETGLGTSSVSVARVGVQLGLELFESFEGKRVLLLGAGEMAESAMEGLREAGVQCLVANRSQEPARRLAERFGGSAIPLGALEAELEEVDVLLTSIAFTCYHPLLVGGPVKGYIAPSVVKVHRARTGTGNHALSIRPPAIAPMRPEDALAYPNSSKIRLRARPDWP